MSELAIVRFPGLIDPHVHFRTPGQEHKEDFYTGSRAALAGGVVIVLDMPNNTKLVVSRELLEEKRRLAAADTVCDIGFYLGTQGEENEDLMASEPYVKALKLYLNPTTGHFFVKDPDKIERVFRNWESEKPIAVHAEGDRWPLAVRLAEKYGRTLVGCHLSEPTQLDDLDRAKNRRPGVVFGEVTPHHLAIESIWSSDVYKKMNPPLVELPVMGMLRKALANGLLDYVGTDHAPHTKEEKESGNPPAGVTGLETMMVILLMLERAGDISINRVKEVTHDAAARIFNIVDEPGTYIEVARNSPWRIRGDALQTKCHTTPFEAIEVQDKVHKTVIRGTVVYHDGEILAQRGSGRVL